MRFNLNKCKVIHIRNIVGKKQIGEDWGNKSIWRLAMGYYVRKFCYMRVK
jgi:hypothetical protein